MAETGNCSRGAGKSYNNAFGIMEWPNGIRRLKRYKTCADSYADFKMRWARSYRTFPTLGMAIKWTGDDHAQQWLANVKHYYYN